MIDGLLWLGREAVWWTAEALVIAPPLVTLGAAAFGFVGVFVLAVRR